MNFRASLLLGMALPFLGFSQSFDHYQPLQSSGTIPSDFTEAYTNKYQRERLRIDENAGRRDRKREDKFHLRSEYLVDEYLISGKVIFGDTITEYCNHILDHLLKDDPGLRHKLRIYVAKSPVVNAYATGNGIIFINLGLIAQVENEAQLAYVIAHEVIHYKNEHVLNQYIEQEKIKNGEDLYREEDRLTKMEALSSYSKTQELEADIEGFDEYYANSGYTHRAPLFVMDVLQYSYLPFDEIPFKPEYLNTEYLVFPNDYYLETTASITAEADYDDTHSSHPNIKTRKLEIIKHLKGDHKGQEYIISESTFHHAQKIARYEISRLYLNNGQYGQAVYHNFLLKEKYGSDLYQELSLAKAITQMSIYRNYGKLYEHLSKWDKIEGESQQVYHFFDKLSVEELNTLAVVQSYEGYRKYPDNEAFKRLFLRNLKELVFQNELKPEDFIRDQQITEEKDNVYLQMLDSSATSRRGSKIANINKRKQEEQTQALEADEFYKNAFIPYWGDTLFVNNFNKFEEEYRTSSYSKKRSYKSHKKHGKYEENYELGIDHILCVTPQYAKLDERKEDGISYLDTDEGQENYRQLLHKISDQVDLRMDMLDYKNIGASDVEEYNDISMIKSWIAERLMHENSGAMVSDFDYMEPIIEKYGTPYISYTGNLSLRVKEENVGGRIAMSVLIYPMLPFTLASLLIPDYKSFNYFFLFDLRNDRAMLAEYNNYSTNDSPDYLRSIIYNHLIQVKAR